MSKLDLAKRALEFLSPHKKRFCLATFILLIETALGMLAAAANQPLFDKALLNGNLSLLWRILVFQTSIYLFASLLNLIRSNLYVSIGLETAQNIGLKVYANLQRQDMGFFVRTKLSDIYQRVYSDAQALEGALSHALGGTLVSAIKLVSVGAFMFYWNATLSLIAFAALVVVAALAALSSSISTRLLKKFLEKNSQLGNHLFQTLSLQGHLLASLFNRFGWNRENLAFHWEGLRNIALKKHAYPQFCSQGISLTTYLLGSLVFLIGGHLLAKQSMSLGTLMAFASLVGYLTAPAIQLAAAAGFFNEAALRFQRILEYMELPPAISQARDVEQPAAVRGHLLLDNVSFFYGSKSILNKVSLSVEPGQVSMLMGPSGCGKTTLSYLMMRLLDPKSGSVELDGVNIRKWDLEKLRAQFSYVGQDPLIFNSTLRENIALGRNLSDQELDFYCELACLKERIAALPQKYDTVVGEQGAVFSGGEKQRIAIARALSKEARIYIFDEPTAFLDSENEKNFLRAINYLKAKRASIFIITHRESLLEAADIVYRLEEKESCFPRKGDAVLSMA